MTFTTSDASIATWSDRLRESGFVALAGSDLRALLPPGPEVDAFHGYWTDLPRDEYLLDGGAYRYRRYGRLSVRGGSGQYVMTPLPYTGFLQDLPGHAGRSREFAPVRPETLGDPVLHGLVRVDLDLVAGDGSSGAARPGSAGVWEVGLHLIRVVADHGHGLPTPEGRHRDGHDHIGMHLLGRHGCAGGESIIYRDGHDPLTLLLDQPLDSLVVRDAALTHEVSAISPAGSRAGVRDMLLVDINAR